MTIKHNPDTDTLTIQLSPRDAQDASNKIKPHLPHISRAIDVLIRQAVDKGEDVILTDQNHIAAYDVYVKYANHAVNKKAE